MPSIVAFNGRTIIEPGAYARIIGGESNPPEAASFGNVLIIDTGSMAGYGYGSGITGELKQGPNSIYKFETLDAFRVAVAGSIMWDVAKWLFKPSRDPGFRGVSSILYVRAATTTNATATYTWTGGGPNGGVFAVETRTEGLAANGVENATSLLIERGFGMRMSAGTVDTAKFVVEFYRGTFRGLDFNNVPFDNISAAAGKPDLLVKSIEFSNISELIAWAQSNQVFQTYFFLGASTAAAGSGVVNAGDLAASAGNELFAGGTETYNASDLTQVFKYIREVDYTFILADKWETNMTHATLLQILGHIVNDSEFQRHMYVGAGADSTAYATSLTAAGTYNSPLVHLMYSRTKKNDIAAIGGVREYPSVYHAAAALGRAAGQEPQLPTTYKELDFDGVKHELAQPEREQALLKGLMHERYVSDLGWVINQDVNTKQNNELDIYENGTSPHGSIMRIAMLLNKELTIELRKKFVGQNANTASPADVKAAVEGRLKFRTATKTDDNLILSFKNVRVTLIGSDYSVQYAFTPNGPVNRFFVTGFMYNVNLSA